ncbi:MAG: response regulator transcription factor [Bacteroidota bacterium]
MKQRILVIDDNEMMRAFLAQFLKKFYEVRTASGSSAAWKIMDNEYVPDLIMLDLRMPEVSGLEMLQQLKSSVLYNEIPVVILSSINKTNEKVDCLRAGAADYITKPFNPQEVAARIQYHLKVNQPSS